MPNENLQYQNRFSVTFNSESYKHLTKNITDISLPSINIGFTEQPTPIKRIYIPGDSLDITDFTVAFMLDEEYENYRDFLLWMNELRNFNTTNTNRDVIDISIILLNAKYNPYITINLEDCFPYSLSELALDYQIDDTVPNTFSVIFKTNNLLMESV